MAHGLAQGDEQQTTSTPQAGEPTKRVKGRVVPLSQAEVRALVGRAAQGLAHVDPNRVADRIFEGFPDGSTQRELDALGAQVAASLVAEEPEYGRLAARLLAVVVRDDLAQAGIASFSDSIARGHELGIVNNRLLAFVWEHEDRLNAAIDLGRDDAFEYFGLRTVVDRYLLRHPRERGLIEGPQHFFARVACALADTVEEAIEFYDLLSSLGYLPSSPTLFNAGTSHEQLSSCFLADSPVDDLASIYQKYTDVAMLSKFSGGIGLAYHRVRSRGSLIRSTNGHSNGIVPWLKTLDASVAAVNQGGRRRGACCVYLEPWHADIEEFLELRENTGDQARRTHNLNLACWVPDLFMRRVEQDGMWSLFDPSVVPALPDLWGEPFEQAYEQAEAAGKATRRVKARDLYARMMRSLAQTGNGWMTFKDTSNRTSNQTALPESAIHHSNLCVAPETLILVRRGGVPAEVPIGTLKDQEVEVWNGFRWSPTTVRKTGPSTELVRVCMSGHVLLDCTPQHQFAVARPDGQDGWDLVAASDLKPGTKLARFSMPPEAIAHQVEREVVEVVWMGRVAETFCFTEEEHHLGTFNGVVTGQCTEILEVSSEEETAVCNIGSINLGRHVTGGAVDFVALARTVRIAIRRLDRTIDHTLHPIASAATSNHRWRPVGLGVMGLQDVFFQLRMVFGSAEAEALSAKIAEEIYFTALTTSCDLAAERGAHPAFAETRAARGELQFDAWKVTPKDAARWDALRARIQQEGLRNSLLIAIAPTATIASIAGCYECIEPQLSNLFKRETLSGDFLQINRYLVGELRALGRWNAETREAILAAEGSIQGVSGLTEKVRAIYRTVWEIPMRSLIDMAAARGPFIDQSQSLNLFVENPSIGKISAMYFYAWKKGLKTTYYLRSRPATRIARSSAPSLPSAAVRQGPSTEALAVAAAPEAPPSLPPDSSVAKDEASLACSLENPESCEACQ